MKKKKLIIISTIILLLAVLSIILFCGKAKPAKIFVATDTHYLSSRINDKGTAFTEMVNNADGKLVQYCDEIFSAFSEDVVEAKPDVLILSGDLTFNGEKASHEDFAKKLDYIQSKGVQVLTIAGNHDVNITNTAGYKDDKYVEVENISPLEFKKLYYNFGMKQAESVDENSLSYLYKVNKSLYVLMLDTNVLGKNFVQDRSYKWIEQQLKMVAQNKAQVITVSHQNLFAHNEQLSFGYQLYDANELLELLNKYNVKCHLSGHIHMQHTKTDGITEVVNSSLLVAPVQYGVINFNGKYKYSTKTVDVEKWAKSNNIKDENLLKFSTFATKFFKDSAVKKSFLQLENSNLNKKDKNLIATTFAELNTSYFAGTKIDTSQLNDGIELCKNQNKFLNQYIETMLEEAQNDYTSIKIKWFLLKQKIKAES